MCLIIDVALATCLIAVVGRREFGHRVVDLVGGVSDICLVGARLHMRRRPIEARLFARHLALVVDDRVVLQAG